ncbi:MAG: oxidoreductase [Ruminococcaceae bacterium]|nr:oxidoreductase [Oscillospiraceae bacterium]
MNQTSAIISTYSADTFGVCSALFELGGMVIMHDASGCNSTYTTHDEPRWYDMDSMVYISGLSEMEAILGDDEKLIDDIVAAANDLHPNFIAIAGTPIPAMTGFDFQAVAAVIEERTGIPTFGFATTGMNTYVSGASMAFEVIARHFVDDTSGKTPEPSANILGLTPLDFSVNGSDRAIARFLEDSGYRVLSTFAMGSTPEEISRAGKAHVNLVVSSTGLAAANVLRERFGTPYVVGVPISEAYRAMLRDALGRGEVCCPASELPDGNIVVIGEAVTSVSLASAIELTAGRAVRVLCPTEHCDSVLRGKDRSLKWEEELSDALRSAKMVIADPLYRPICPEGVRFVELPAESFSGRIFRARIPDLVSHFDEFLKEVL